MAENVLPSDDEIRRLRNEGRLVCQCDAPLGVQVALFPDRFECVGCGRLVVDRDD